RERVGLALEALARGLIAAEQADEALQLAEQSLAIHELEYGALTRRASELRRLVFVAQVHAGLLADASKIRERILNPIYDSGRYREYTEELRWMASVYGGRGHSLHARQLLLVARKIAAQNQLTDVRAELDLELGTEAEREL